MRDPNIPSTDLYGHLGHNDPYSKCAGCKNPFKGHIPRAPFRTWNKPSWKPCKALRCCAACAGEQPSEGAAGGGGRNSLAWAVVIRRGFRCLGQTTVLCEAQAGHRSRAALVAEQQALLQEQRAPVQAITRSDKPARRDGYPNDGVSK